MSGDSGLHQTSHLVSSDLAPQWKGLHRLVAARWGAEVRFPTGLSSTPQSGVLSATVTQRPCHTLRGGGLSAPHLAFAGLGGGAVGIFWGICLE